MKSVRVQYAHRFWRSWDHGNTSDGNPGHETPGTSFMYPKPSDRSFPQKPAIHLLPSVHYPSLVMACITAWILSTSVGCWSVVDTLDEATKKFQSTDEQKEAAQYVDEEGNVDWRKRVDDVSESIEKAKSNRKWGKDSAAIDAALKAARLMPPTSKDFDLAEEMESQANGGQDQNSDIDGEMKSPDGQSNEITPSANGSVSNAEVAKLRQALQDVFAALESDGVGNAKGKSGKAPNYVTDAIEIR